LCGQSDLAAASSATAAVSNRGPLRNIQKAESTFIPESTTPLFLLNIHV
jgi:hypothetical protein